MSPMRLKLIRKQNLVVISIKPVGQSPLEFLKKINERITTSDIVVFTRQLSIMVNAGLPITDALNYYSDPNQRPDAKKWRLKY